jgi:predicted nucleic acid-binding protein
MVIVDTTVWIDYLRGIENEETRWLDSSLENQRIGLTDLILCEVLQGVHNQATFSRVKEQLLKFHIFDTGGEILAIASAQNYRLLRHHGRTVKKTIDCVIATFCVQAGHQLLHRDHDYDPFESLVGLQVVRP